MKQPPPDRTPAPIMRLLAWLLGPAPKNDPLPPEEFTCHGCPSAGTCEFAWDLYNTDGDCLAEK